MLRKSLIAQMLRRYLEHIDSNSHHEQANDELPAMDDSRMRALFTICCRILEEEIRPRPGKASPASASGVKIGDLLRELDDEIVSLLGEADVDYDEFFGTSGDENPSTA